jgi:hypothetical protein
LITVPKLIVYAIITWLYTFFIYTTWYESKWRIQICLDVPSVEFELTKRVYIPIVESSWNVMAHGDAREEKWRGNKRMEWVTSKRHMTAAHRLARAVQTLQADAHISPASSRLNWRPRRFKWTRPFRRKTNPGFCACAITFQTQSTTKKMHLLSQIIYSFKKLYMFQMVFPSIIRSSKLRIQQRYTSKSCCYLLLLGIRWICSSTSSPIAAGSSSCLTYTVAVYAVLSSWWRTERPSETCRAFYKNK